MNQKFPIYLISNKLFSSSQKAFSLELSKKLGEKIQGKIIYSEFEAFYLVETKRAELIQNSKPLKEEQIIKSFSKKHKEFYIKYLVFKELRKKAYIVKTGSKFGAEFRVYCNSKKSKDFSACHSHAKYICHVITNKLDIRELIAKARIAHSTAKKLLLAIVDSEENILFYEIDWIKI